MAGMKVAHQRFPVEVLTGAPVPPHTHFVFKSIVQNRGAKAPQSFCLHSGDNSVARHFLASVGVDHQKSRHLIAIKEPLKGEVSGQPPERVWKLAQA